jgi:hypothetical protein
VVSWGKAGGTDETDIYCVMLVAIWLCSMASAHAQCAPTDKIYIDPSTTLAVLSGTGLNEAADAAVERSPEVVEGNDNDPD